MTVTYFPFSAFRPDGTSYGAQLDRLVNAIPWNGGARSLRKMQQVAALAEDGPVNGAYVHIFQADNSQQIARPDADVSAGGWAPSTGSDLFAMVDEASHDDTDYISIGGAPTAAIVRLSLSDLATAAAATGHVVNWRYRLANLGSSDAWTLKCRLMEGATQIDEQEVTGTGDTAGVLQTQLAPTTVTITDYTNLFLEFEATIAGTVQKARPIADISGGVAGWKTQAGSGMNLYTTIDETVASDADYIEGPVIGIGGSATYVASLGAVADPASSSGHVMRYRYRASNSGVTVRVQLLEGASTVIATWSHANASTSWTTAAQTLSAAQADAITDYGNLRFEVRETFPASAASTVSQTTSPNAEISRTTSPSLFGYGHAGSSNFAAALAAADGNNVLGLESSTGTIRTLEFSVELASLTDPQVSDGHVLTFAPSAFSSPSINVPVQLWQGSTLITTIGVTPSISTYTLTATEADKIASYVNLRMDFKTPSGMVAGDSFTIDYAELATPAPRRAQVSWVEFEVPPAGRADVTWTELRTPSDDLSYRGDEPTIFAGTPGSLYTVDGAGFTDVSGDAYGAGGTLPGAWRLCSFGNNVIATNFVDPVQYRAANSGDFDDMMTSTEKPKGRFVAAARDHLMLAGIDHADSDSAGIWWSALDNIRDFDPSVTTQCDRRKLYSTPGQVMGLVGGEYVRVWKRRSMYVGLWVGEDVVWRFDALSNSVGTPFPSSVVEGSNEVMFWGGNTFYRQTGFEQPEEVGRGVISGYLTDAEFSPGHIQPLQPNTLAEEDQIMIGAYDPLAGVYVWVYQGPGDPIWRHSRAVAYNPVEDRWALFELPGDVSTVIQQPNTSNAQTHLLRGLLGFTFDGTDSAWFRFDDATVYEQTFRSKVFPINLADDDRPRPARIRGILPIFSAVTNELSFPAIEIKVEGSYDPRFIDPDEQEYLTASVDHRNMFPFDITAIFWRVTVTVPEMAGRAINAVDGLYIDWEPIGDD